MPSLFASHTHWHTLCFGYPIPCDDAYVIATPATEKNQKHSTVETANGYRARIDSARYSAIAYCALYVCALIIRLRYHLFDFIFLASLFFGAGVWRWSISCFVFSFFSRFHLSRFFLFLLTFAWTCCALFACSWLYVVIHLSRSVSVSLLVFLSFCFSGWCSCVSACGCEWWHLYWAWLRYRKR